MGVELKPVDALFGARYNADMTEDDTFNKLRRTPFPEMRLIVRQFSRAGASNRAKVKLLMLAGWSVQDYNKELARVVGNQQEPQLIKVVDNG